MIQREWKIINILKKCSGQNPNLSQSDTTDVKKVGNQHWKIEDFHRELKQVTGIESCQSRKARIQKNHIVHFCVELSQQNSAFNGQKYLPIKE